MHDLEQKPAVGSRSPAAVRSQAGSARRVQAKANAGATAKTRFDRADRTLRQIRSSVGHEDKDDAPAGGKPLTVASQVSAQLGAAEKERKVAEGALGSKTEGTAVAGFETAVDALKRAYLGSELTSRDPFDATEVWAPDATRDILGSDAVHKKCLAWQKKNARHYVKFAIPPRQGSAPLQVRVGYGISHVQISGGNAIAAGLLRFDESGARVVGELENVSGGFRPGPLRNSTAADAIGLAGYSITTQHAHPDGSYDGSRIYGK